MKKRFTIKVQKIDKGFNFHFQHEALTVRPFIAPMAEEMNVNYTSM